MVAALPQLHHGVDQVGHVVLVRSFRQEGEVLLQDGPVVFLLDVSELHLQENQETHHETCTQPRARPSQQRPPTRDGPAETP